MEGNQKYVGKNAYSPQGIALYSDLLNQPVGNEQKIYKIHGFHYQIRMHTYVCMKS